MRKKLTKLEALRGFAAVYVVFHHLFADGLTLFGKNINVLFKFGQEAVILFFVLSGFVIYYSYNVGKDKSFKTFFLKRFLRIYIPLFIVFATDAILKKAGGYEFTKNTLYDLVGNILMLQDVASLKPNVVCSPFLGNSPLWSLSYEWWFYLVFFFVYNKFKDKSSLIVYLIGTIATITYLIYPNFVNRELMYLVIWWAGADIAKLFLEDKPMSLLNVKTPLIFLTICTLLLAVNVKLQNANVTIGVSPFLELRHFAFSIVAIICAFLWNKLHWVGFKYTFGIFEFIAPISFGIYISHWFLIVDAHYLDAVVTNPIVRTLLYIVVCVAFAYLVEKIIYVKLNKYIMQRFFNKAQA